METDNVKQRLIETAAGLNHKKYIFPAEGNYIVNISGSNKVSKEALLGRKLIIRHFPFTIGRSSSSYSFSFRGPDFLINDNEPGHISRKHLSIDLQDGQIIVKDENSRFGSLINNEQLGKNAGGKEWIHLRYGKNEVRLGGRSSPFLFEIEVLKRDESNVLEDYVRCEDNIVPVSTLYIKLCQATKEIISPSNIDSQKRITMAINLSANIADNPQIAETLYCYATHPETFSDVIVAHSINVCIYAIQLARGLSYDREYMIKIGAAALLHDIGMYVVPQEITYKKGTISRGEYEILKRHAIDGYERLHGADDNLTLVPTVAYEHHERVDGSGYPKGKKSLEEIIELLGLVDFFEAVTHYRPQRGPITPHQGIKMLMNSKNPSFSPNLMKTFVNIFSLFPVFSIVRLNTGEIGQVVKSNLDIILRPIVRVLLDKHGQPLTQRKEVNLSNEEHLFITKDISDRIFIDSYFKI